MVGSIFIEDQDVIEVGSHIGHSTKHFVHSTLEGSGSSVETKGHSSELKLSVLHHKGGLWAIFFLHGYLIVGVLQIESTYDLRLMKVVEDILLQG